MKTLLKTTTLAWLAVAGTVPAEVVFPPRLPGGKEFVSHTSEDFLKAPETIRKDVAVAETAPTIDFMFYPGQDYPGKPWSVWGDGVAMDGKYYSAIGDHLAPQGTGLVFEYDPATHGMRELVDVKKLLAMPDGHYVPGKVHSRVDMGADGWLYFATHRGSTRTTTDEFHYQGDWILRCDPKSGNAEVVARGPVPKHCIPCSVLDPERLIFYGGTAPGSEELGGDIHFFAYDIRAGKVLYSGPGGPARAMVFAKSTGRVYFTPGKEEGGPLMRYDPEAGGEPVAIEGMIGIRAATEETPDGFVYTVSSGQRGEAILYSFNTKTEEVENLGPAAVGTQNYITSIDADPTGRFLYYIPGAHGGSEKDGSAVVQFEVKTGKKKVIAFPHPFFEEKYGSTLKGTFSSALDPAGDKLYVTWNNSRSGKVWDSCVLTVIHIPERERE